MSRLKIIFLLSLLFLCVSVSAEPVDFKLGRTLRANRFSPLCVPFSVEASQVGELFAIASADGYKIRVFPVNSIPAGVPCVVRTTKDISSLQIESDSIMDSNFFVIPLPWEGGTLEGTTSGYTWVYNTPEGKKINSTSIVFLILNLQNLSFTVNLENIQVKRFLDEVRYETDSESQILDYKHKKNNTMVRLDQPNPVSIPLPLTSNSDSLVLTYHILDNENTTTDTIKITGNKSWAYIYNLIPQRSYQYQVTQNGVIVTQGRFNTIGRIRMLTVPGSFNIRDLGGWTVDDKTTVYGRLIRGSELNGVNQVDSLTLMMLLRQGIGAEIDMRSKNDNDGAGISAFGFLSSSETNAEQSTYLYTNSFPSSATLLRFTSYLTRVKQAFLFLLRNLREGRAVYYHCMWGADRTGVFSMLLEGLMGFSYDQIMKDYELTTFYISAVKQKDMRQDIIDYIETFEGNTLKEKFEMFFTSKVGVSQHDIEEFVNIMFGKEPIYDAIRKPIIHNGSSSFFDLYGRKVHNNRKGFLIERNESGEIRKIMK